MNDRCSAQSYRLLAFQAFVMTCGLYGCETWNSRKDHVTKLEGAQFSMLSHMLRYHWSFRKSFADVIHRCRSVDVDILPAGIMISRQRLAYFGHVCRMGPDRLPKRLLMARLVLDDDQKTRIGPEQSYANVVAEDCVAFGLIQRIPGLNPTQWNDHRWRAILGMTSDRDVWRCKVKRDGIGVAMLQFFESRCVGSNKRHANDVDFVPKVPHKFVHICSLHKKPQETLELCDLVDFSDAIAVGAVCTGRGRYERRGRVAAMVPVPVVSPILRVSYARSCLDKIRAP